MKLPYLLLTFVLILSILLFWGYSVEGSKGYKENIDEAVHLLNFGEVL